MRLLPVALLVSFTSCLTFSQTYTISQFAGGGLPANIPAISAGLRYPSAVAVDGAGNLLVSSQDNTVLRLDSTTGVLTLVAGNGTGGYSGDDGLAIAAQLSQPNGIAQDSGGNLYIADFLNNRIRKVSHGVITTVAGTGAPGFSGDNGPATSARLYRPTAIAVDAAGNLYVADWGNYRIRKISQGVITTVAGNGTKGYSGDNGPALSAQLNIPNGVAVDSKGNLYIADSYNHCIRQVSDGMITTLAGNGSPGFGGDKGPASGARLNFPQALAVDSNDSLYIVDTSNYRIRKVTGGNITTVAGGTLVRGDNGLATNARLSLPVAVAVDAAGNLYVVDEPNCIRKVSRGIITTVAGSAKILGGGGETGDGGPANAAQLYAPYGLAAVGRDLYVADAENLVVRKISNGVITTVAGNGFGGYSGDNILATSASLVDPTSVSGDAAGNLYIGDNSHRVRRVSQGVIATAAGNGKCCYGGDNGPAVDAELANPNATVDSAGNLYIADTANHRIRKVSDGVITTVAGNGIPGFSGDNGPATSAQLSSPNEVGVDAAGNLYIADTANNRIRKVSATGVITTIAGNGLAGFRGDNGPATDAQLSAPNGIAVDEAGTVYIADSANNRIRKLSGGAITTIAGNGIPGYSGDDGPATIAQLSPPMRMATDSAGNIYISDAMNNRIRLLTPGALPMITPGGIVPVGSTVPVIQAGSWISIYGSNLANGTFLWKGDFPVSLGTTRVSINNRPAYLWFVSPRQINVQVPDDSVTGTVDVVVTTDAGAAASTVTISPYGPSFSLLGDGRHVAGEIATPGGTGAYGGGTYDLVGPSATFSFSTRPVKAGETLIL